MGEAGVIAARSLTIFVVKARYVGCRRGCVRPRLKVRRARGVDSECILAEVHRVQDGAFNASANTKCFASKYDFIEHMICRYTEATLTGLLSKRCLKTHSSVLSN